jgi:hypothetical protein
MNNKIIVKILAIIVILTSLLIMAGWIFGIPILKSLSPNWVSMKFLTAVCFLFSGAILMLFSYSERKTSFSETLLCFFSFAILLIMSLLIISFIFKISIGVEELFVKEEYSAVKSLTPGMPSFPTMMNFILISLTGVLGIFIPLKIKKVQIINGVIIGLIGAVAVLGYILNIPILYYFIEKVNTGMAFHTAILFVVIGTGFFLLGKEEEE